MNTRYYISLVLSLVLGISQLAAQTGNRLYIPALTAVPGATVSVPVYVENTAEVVAVQFTLQVPQGAELATATAALTSRAANHSVTVRATAPQEYICMIYSPTNDALRGRTGKLMSVEMTLAASMEEGSSHAFVMKDAVLSLRDGTNALTTAEGGTLTLINGPDLTLQNVHADKTAYSPGEAMTVSWMVGNVGGAATADGWTEHISLVQTDGTAILVGTTHYDATLAPAAVVSRQVTLTLPAQLGLDGEARVQVELVPLATTLEGEGAQGNNVAATPAPATFSKQLALTLPTGSIPETYGHPVRCTLARSGNRSQDQTFTLSATADSRLAVPQTVTIPAGQSAVNFYLRLTDNAALDDGALITVTAAGNGYAAVSGQFTIEDNEYPDLQVTASQTQVKEGDTFLLTITATRAPAADIEITLAAEAQSRFTFPNKVKLPAGKTTATAEVTVKNDDLPSLTLTPAFTAYAPGYNRGEVLLILEDDDIPALALTLAPSQVSEGVGPVAVAATLRRTGVTGNKITVRLSDDSEGGIYFGTATIEMAKGVDEVHFNLGPIDNANVDGDRVVNITAAVYISACSCNAQGESAGVVSAPLTILDDDGPALTLKASNSTVKEGGKVRLTVTRNTPAVEDLAVTLIGDQDAQFEPYDHTVTIPAGAAAATVELTSKAGDASGDSFTAIFTAYADGFNKGCCFLMVTDQTLPDARIASLTAAETDIEVGGTAELTILVTNDGAAPLPAGTPVTLYGAGTAQTLRTSQTLSVNETEKLAATVAMPTTIGSGRYYAVVNEASSVKELNYNNNTSAAVTLRTIAPFTAAIATDKSVYQQGESVQLTGQLTGNQTAAQTVEIYVINDGARQTLTAQTDDAGAFAATWTPYATQSGHFIAGACFRGENLRTEMAAFDVYGFRLSRSSVDLYTTVGEAYTGSITLSNPGRLALTGLRAKVVTAAEGTDVTLDIPATLAADGTAQLRYTLLPTQPSTVNQWDKAEVRITTAEGAAASFTIRNYAQNAHADLVASTSYIKTTVVKDSYRDYPLDIINTGKGASGAITLALPGGMTSLSGTTLPSLAAGDTASVVLRFLPTDKMQLNIPVQGSFGINCENGNGTSVNFNITPVSEATGTLVVDVMDELSYYTTEAPHVEGASVVLRNPATGALLAQGVTGADGLYTITLPEGYYQLTVTSPQHDSFQANILLDPGVTTRKAVNLSIQAIQVNWDVKETEVEDVYDIVTTLKFETNVPVPVVELSVPQRIAADELQVGESLIFYATLTNKGLIAAKDAELLLPEGFTHLTFEPLTDYQGLTIAPQQAIQIPVRVTRVGGEAQVKGERRRLPDIDNDPCVAQPGTLYFWDCGLDRKWHRYAVAMQVGSCDSNDPTTWEPTRTDPYTGPTGGWTGGGGPGGGGGWWYSGPTVDYTRVTTTEDTGCEPCQNSFMYKMARCFVKRIPVVKKVLDFVDNLKCVYNVVTQGDLCWVEKIPVISEITEWVDLYDDCIRPLIEPCNPGDFEGEKTPLPWRVSARQEAGGFYKKVRQRAESNYPSYITDFQNKAAIIYDAIDAYLQQGLEICGEECWTTVSADTLSLIAANLQAYAQGTLSAEEFKAIRPSAVTTEQLERLLQRWSNTLSANGDENSIDLQRIQELEDIVSKARQLAEEAGAAAIADYYVAQENDVIAKLEEANSSVCATITLQFKQSMYLTRQAFRGTLTVFNGHETTAMTDVKLALSVTSADGQLATSREFEIHGESLDVFTGDVKLDSGWSLDAQQTGTATVMFIPSKYAAPTEPVDYAFGGTLTYTDPFSGLEVTRILNPVTLTVKPTPELDLTYFMQRDVYGDDPLTEAVEPSEPAEFSLLINNIGYGDATDVRMVTNQPEIIDNEKGLLIDFEILSAQLNGGDKTLALGGAIPTDFGTIPARSQAYAQWWFQSSLLGHFTDYDVEATHVTSYGNPDLSLLNEVTIHELIRSIKVDDGTVTGFVVNDLADAEDTPDMLYFTDGTTAEVAVASGAKAERQSTTEYLLTVSPSQPGWNYGHITDPTFGRARLTAIRRQSDGAEINLRNFWQTDRTLRDGKEWLYENNLHFVDQMAGSTETYVLTFEPRPAVELEVAAFEGVPEDGTVLREPLHAVSVTFNKAIDATTFTADDITLNCQGTRVEAPIAITAVSDRHFTLDLSQATAGNGYYTLTVQTAAISDLDGFTGAAGKTASWIQFTEATTLALSFEEAEVTYGDTFAEPLLTTNSPAQPEWTSTNPLVAAVNPQTGQVTVNAVGATTVAVALAATPTSDAASATYQLTVLPPEGTSQAPADDTLVTVTIPEGQTTATFCSPWPLDFSNATDGCRAYIATIFHDGEVECTEITEAKGGVGLLLIGEPGEYTFPVRTSFETCDGNLLVGTLAPTYVGEPQDDETILVLQGDSFVPINASIVEAGKAYLPLHLDNEVSSVAISLQTQTGVTTLLRRADDAPWYHISGVKVSRPAAKGIYIRAGRKMVK